MATRRSIEARGAVAARLGLVACALVQMGCLGEPEIEDRWTRIDVTASNVNAFQTVQAGPLPVAMGVDITYRRILTGFAVAELRASATLSNADVAISTEADRLRMAADIDRIMASSVTMGRATRAVTGWDHLIQHIDFNFTGFVPTMLDSAGVPIGAPRGLFLVCYMGSGTEIQLPGGADSLVVTPFNSQAYEILPVGLEVTGP